MSQRRVSIAVKMLGVHLAAFVVASGIVGALQYRTVQKQMYEHMESSATNLLQTVEETLAEHPDLFDSKQLGTLVLRISRKLPDVARISVIDRRLRIVADSDPRLVGQVTDQSALIPLLRGQPEERFYYEREGRKFYRLSRPLRGPYDPAIRSDVMGAFSIDMQVSPIDERILRDIGSSLVPVTGVALLIALTLALLAQQQFVRPLLELTAAARRFGRRGESSRVVIRTGDELEVLAGVFNQMVDERRRAELTLSVAHAEAEAASRVKGEFLANMSHEIRTPMNGVMGMLELALDTPLTESQREYLTIARASAESLLTVINDVLDFSKIEAGKLELHPHPFALPPILSDTVNTLGLRADRQRIELALHVAPDVPRDLVGDGPRLRQILTNLVGNAIKFTNDGEVVIRVEVAERSDDGITVHFAVRDTGIGIPAEKQKLIFEAFAQADGSTTREYGGTGLGLAISSQLVRLMGGRIWVESEVGRGSTFHFTARFGAHRGPALGAERETPAALSGMRVLVVDDNATNRQILSEMLGHWRMRPVAVDSGQAALAALDAAYREGAAFPLIVVDAQMPQMDGFELIERIRLTAAATGATIMMLSSLDQEQGARRCRELGVACYLVKPIRSMELLDAIVTALALEHATRPRVEAPAVAITTATRPLRVLLAEDNAVNQKLASALLVKRGHAVVVVPNGRLAAEAVETEHFDVVLMDVQMPEMSGFEATARIRAGEQARGGRRVPIVALTARAMAGDRERCLEGGMDDYVAKPLKAAVLFETMERLAESSAAPAMAHMAHQPAAEPPAPPPAPAVPPPAAASPVAVEPGVLDVARLRATLQDDDELLGELAELYRSEYPRLLGAIRAGVAGGDAAAVGEAAHTLKGAVGNLAADRAFAAALDLERMGRGAQLADAAAALARLEAELVAVDEALGALVTRSPAAGPA